MSTLDFIDAILWGQTWQITPELRWHVIIRELPGGFKAKGERVLQQKWVRLDSGAIEWRAVPEVME